MKTENEYFQIVYEGMTYDRDYGEKLKLVISFSNLQSAMEFRDGFPYWCKYFEILEDSEFDFYKRPHVSFRDIEELKDENRFPMNCYAEELSWYDTGYIFPDEKAKIEKIITTREVIDE